MGTGPDSSSASTSPLHPATAAPAGAPLTRDGTSVTVVFDLTGGTATFPTSQAVTKGQHCTRPTSDPTRAGYLFDGWFTGDTPTAYDFNQPVTTDGLTLKAHWTKGNTTWSMTPNRGTTHGGDTITLTPPAPRGLRFTQVSAGRMHSLAIGSDGNLYSWGNNHDGQLGRTTTTIGTDTPNPTPGPVDKPTGAPAGFTWTQATVGGWHSMAIGSDGNLYTWGDNTSNQLGPNITNLHPNPRPILMPKPAGVPAGFTWTQAIAGDLHSMAFGSDGNLYTWGDNYYGQLGRNTTISTANPNPIPFPVAKPAGAPAGFTWTQATAGRGYSMAVGSDGNLYTWGSNQYGQLGRTTNNGTANPTPTPGPVSKPAGAPAGFTWTQATAGKGYSMAFGSDGNLYTWGSNQYGQPGRTTTDIGTTNPNPTPGPVDKPAGAPAGFTWTQTSASDHSMAFGSDGNLYTWGSNQYGQLGRTTNNGTTSPNPTPGQTDFPESAVPTGVVFGGTAGTGLARNPDDTWRVTTPAHIEGRVDTVITWTRNGPQTDTHLSFTYGTPSSTVTFDTDGGTPQPPDQQVAENQQVVHPANPTRDGYLFDGWFIGDTTLGYDFTLPVTEPLTLKAHWTSVSSQHWTISPDHGSELGGEQVTLTPPARRGIRFSQINGGNGHTLSIASDGNLYTWGTNLFGQLGRAANSGMAGYPNRIPGRADNPTSDPNFTWMHATGGWFHSMGIGSDGNLYTWGDNEYGQLGRTTNIGTQNPNATPVMVPKPSSDPNFTWKQINAGYWHSMALGSDGNLYTWGDNESGQLGRTANSGRGGYSSTPAAVPKPSSDPNFTWTQFAGGGYHSMAVGSDGNLYTWGWNYTGQLGRTTPNIGEYIDNVNPTPTMVAKPTSDPNFTWKQITAGQMYSMAIGSDGNIYAWGDNQFGQLGSTTNNGTNSPNPVPTVAAKPTGAPAGFTWKRISAGHQHSVAYGSDGNIYTWGRNEYGELGRDTNIGTLNANPTPTVVAKPSSDPNFTWLQETGEAAYTFAFGSDGNLYNWGINGSGQLGRDTPTSSPLGGTATPGPVIFSGPGIPVSVKFGTTEGTGLVKNTDGTWSVTTPEHSPGWVTVAIDWTRDAVAQPLDTSNKYEFRPIAVLPNAGGEGILPLLLVGLLGMGAALAGRRHRRNTTNQTSHE